MSIPAHNDTHCVDLSLKVHTMPREKQIRRCSDPDTTLATSRFGEQSGDGGPVCTSSPGSGDDEYPIHEPRYAAGSFGGISKDDYDHFRNDYMDETWAAWSSVNRSAQGTPEHCSDSDIVIVPRLNYKDKFPSNDTIQQPLKCIVHAANPRENSKCANQEFKTFLTLKHHMIDCHQQPDYCPRCGSTFSHSVDWSSHINARNCEVKSNPLAGVPGVPGDTLDRIMGWKPDSFLSTENNWENLKALLNAGMDTLGATSKRR
ncbi:hypothetical protein QBC43DRAFT_327176 [Cladorrhinum sp. PSN259]|nr:hypothetical protein QBC43DRAFT_327176 [Cladorrhinum sp. PSN259]